MAGFDRYLKNATVNIVNNGYCSNGYYLQDYHIGYDENEATLTHKTNGTRLLLEYHLLVDQEGNKIGNTKEEVESFINTIL